MNTVSYMLQDDACLKNKSQTGLFTRAVEDSQYQQAWKFMHVICNKEVAVFLSIFESATIKKTNQFFNYPKDKKQFLWLSGQLRTVMYLRFLL